jgi:hypothetical protein
MIIVSTHTCERDWSVFEAVTPNCTVPVFCRPASVFVVVTAGKIGRVWVLGLFFSFHDLYSSFQTSLNNINLVTWDKTTLVCGIECIYYQCNSDVRTGAFLF